MLLNNPYYYHPQSVVKQVADDVLYYISQQKDWSDLFEAGKMLGILILEEDSAISNCSTKNPRVHYYNNTPYLAAYSGVINGLTDDNQFFVPPIYDLQNPDDFYLQKDEAINIINRELSSMMTEAGHLLRPKIEQLKKERQQLSIALQNEIFSHFNLLNPAGKLRNIIDIFADAKRGLPPGGTGECAAPRLLQYAYQNQLKPKYLAEFWYGKSPRNQLRIHGQFYPSCIEKCSPLLKYMLPELSAPEMPESQDLSYSIIYEDQYLILLNKPSGLLSVRSKDPTQPNVETLLHKQYPACKGPMLVHRLDQATSGIMIAAKDALTHKALQQQFEQKTIQKHYLAILRGHLSSSCGIIHLPLSVNPDDRPRQVVSIQFGKVATTYYERIDDPSSYDELLSAIQTTGIKDLSIVRLSPLTGRTHQLRVHCASTSGLDTPIVGDQLYDILDLKDSNNKAPRLYLHAQEINFTHPITNEQMRFSAAIK